MYDKRRLLTVAALLIGLWILGITGYVIIEDWNILDAIYMTTISLTTVDYDEVHPLSPAGRIFTARISRNLLCDCTAVSHFLLR
jgi:voltage-gated potassium channel